MKRTEHLTENQLNDYLGNSALDGEAKHVIGRHLLQCDLCLKRLPQPTVQQFWMALMTDENADDAVDERQPLAERLKFIVQKLMQPKIFAFSTAVLVVVLFFSTFIWLNATKTPETQREIAQNFEVKDSQPVFNQTGNVEIEKPDVFPSVEGDIPSAPATTRVIAKRELPSTNNDAPKQNLKTVSRNDFNLQAAAKLPDAKKATISSTRGGLSTLPKCGREVITEVTTGANGDAVTLKWKKVPKAAKYHLYVSDEEEILLDEFETVEGTSFVLKKPLDPLKTYQWKVVVTLENGQTVISNTQKFTVKDLKSDQKKSKKKENPDVRCSEDK